MNRRRYLGVVVGTTVGGVAGCTGRERRAPIVGGTTSEPPTQPVRVSDVDLPVPRSEMYSALPQDYIPAIVDPVFAADWSGLALPPESEGETTTLPDDETVIGVVRDGDARAYPLRVLDWHEVVNDDFHGPLVVTYCVQCGSAVVADRVVRGEPTAFGVSGLLWRADLVMYDRATESLWSQLLATAIYGPATGERLQIQPSTLTTWGAWRAEYPGTEVLLPPPQSTTVDGPDSDGSRFDYFTPRYAYDEAYLIGYERSTDRLHPQELVVGVEADGVARAYPFQTVTKEGVVNDVVGDAPVVVAVAPGKTLVAYDRRVGERTLRFTEDGDEDEFMRAGGSRWRRTTGVAVDGPHRGTELRRANDLPAMFWLSWSKFHEESTVYGDTAE